jgi:hypothetical protein
MGGTDTQELLVRLHILTIVIKLGFFERGLHEA